MDQNAVQPTIIDFILKGGPPWGFRIKQKYGTDQIIISKVNCGGRAHKSGIKNNDEIVAVNYLEVDNHPLTLIRRSNDSDSSDIDPSFAVQLTKLDFTYQLIKHTLNRQLHIKVRRHRGTDAVQPCCYFYEEGQNEAYNIHSQSEEEILSPGEENEQNEIRSAEFYHPFHHHHYLHHHKHEDPPSPPKRIEQPGPSGLPRNLPHTCLSEPAQESCFHLPLTPDSDADSEMTGVIKGPSYKAKAPKNIWSPGSTTSSGSDLTPPNPTVTASATQATLSRRDGQTQLKNPSITEDIVTATGAHGLPLGFRPVKMNPGSGTQGEASLPATSEGGTTTTGGDAYITPSSPSEISLPEGGDGSKLQRETSTSSDRKYWTLPRQHHFNQHNEETGQSVDPSFRESDEILPRCLAGKGIKQVITEKEPPPNAKLVYESPSTKYFTLPTSHTETRAISLPPPPKYEGIGPVDEAGVPLALRTGVKDEYGSDWYKTMFRRLHKSDRPRSELDQPIRVKVRSSRSRDRCDTDYHSEDEISTRNWPRNIADYKPGHSSIAIRERDKFYEEIRNYIDSIFTEVFAQYLQETSGNRTKEATSAVTMSENQAREPEEYRRQVPLRDNSHHKNCVFNALANGYESDSSYIIHKKEPKTVPTPASRSTYCAIQRGDMDIPMTGLQKPAPAPRAHKVGSYSTSFKTLGPSDWRQPEKAPLLLTDPPKRPPTPLQMNDIDDWHKQINEDLNFIYQTLDRKPKNSSHSGLQKSMTTSNISPSKGFRPVAIPAQTKFNAITTPAFGYHVQSNEPTGWQPNHPSSSHTQERTIYNPSPSSSIEINFGPQHSQIPLANSAVKRSLSWTDRADRSDHQRYVRNVNYDDIGSDGTYQSRATSSSTNINLAPLKLGGYSSDLNAASSNEAEIEKLIQDFERESPHRFDEGEVNIHFKTPIQQLVKSSDHSTEDELVKFQRDVLRRYHENEYERRLTKEAQRRHHFTPTQDHIVNLDRYQKAYTQKDEPPQLLARVLFDFHALSSREISVKKGDIVIIIRPVNHNWVEIEDSQSGLKGLVPRNYLDYEQEGVAKAKYDFDAKTSVEVSLKRGEMLTVIRKVDDNWFEGTNGRGETGIFPCSYVEILKTPLYLQLNNNSFARSPSPWTDSGYGRGHSHPLSPPRPSSPVVHVNGTVRSRDLFELANASRDRNNKLYRAIYPYKPQQIDELELLPGDVLTVTMHCDDGWFVGHSASTGQFGTFPGNYVEPLM